MWLEQEHNDEGKMNERLRQFLIFIITAGSGTFFILLNLPLVVVLPFTVAIGFASLVVLGAIPINMILHKGVKPKKTPLFKNHEISLDTKKSPERIGIDDETKPVPVIIKEKKRGISFYIDSIVSSFKMFRTILTTRQKSGKKNIEEIDKLLNGTINEHIKTSAMAEASAGMGGVGSDTTSPGQRGKSDTKSLSDQAPTEDPFLSLSSDELESGLLDGVYEEKKISTKPIDSEEIPLEPNSTSPGGSGIAMEDTDIPIPPQQISSEPPEIVPETVPENEPDLDDFGDFEDTGFGDENLGELDAIDFDKVNLDEETADKELEPTSIQTSAGSSGSPSSLISPGSVQETSTDQSDMVIFTKDTNVANDMINSIAADIKVIKKSEDLVLLRELKDFKAPSEDIEAELDDLYKALDSAADKQKKLKKSTNLPIK
jgi:hypothetical protein